MRGREFRKFLSKYNRTINGGGAQCLLPAPNASLTTASYDVLSIRQTLVFAAGAVLNGLNSLALNTLTATSVAATALFATTIGSLSSAVNQIYAIAAYISTLTAQTISVGTTVWTASSQFSASTIDFASTGVINNLATLVVSNITSFSMISSGLFNAINSTGNPYGLPQLVFGSDYRTKTSSAMNMGWFDQISSYAGLGTQALIVPMSLLSSAPGVLTLGNSVQQTNIMNTIVCQQQPTWFVTGVGANGIAAPGAVYGVPTGGQAGFTLLTIAGANANTYGSFNTSTGTFSTSIAGLYMFELCVFDNTPTYSGSPRRTCFNVSGNLSFNQYVFFNMTYAALDGQAWAWTYTLYLPPGANCNFTNQSSTNVTWYFAYQHTTLRILRLY